MADGYARARGKVGVCMATCGPGATNLVTGIATAMLDSIPIVAITGQVSQQGARDRRLPGGRHHRHHPARSPSTTSSSPAPKTSPPRFARPSRSRSPAAPARYSWTYQGRAASDRAEFDCRGAAAPAPIHAAPHAARRIHRPQAVELIAAKQARHPRRPRHHALRRRGSGPRLRRAPSRFPSPSPCSASEASLRSTRSHSA